MDLRKRIMSALLAGALVTSVSPAQANATENESENNEVIELTAEDLENMELVEFNRMKGVYTVLVNNKTLYVYMNNKVRNEYLPKDVAIEVAKEDYNTDKVYIYSKVMENPNYVEGVSPETEEFNFEYAISDKTSVEGWTRVQEGTVSSDMLVCTTIELGEFLLKDVDLAKYKTDSKGFGYMEMNRDGEMNDLFYIGNDKVNTLLSKSEALEVAKDYVKNVGATGNKTASIYTKNVEFEGRKTLFALSNTDPGNGWSKIDASKVNDKVQIGTTPEYMDIMFNVYSSDVTKEEIYLPKMEESETPELPPVEDNEPSVDVTTSMVKDKALEYAYANYPEFCILKRTFKNAKGTNETIYLFNVEPFVDGYEIIGNDLIPNDAKIFLNMEYAQDYEYNQVNNTSKTLK